MQFETDSISKVLPSFRHATYEAPSSFNKVSLSDNRSAEWNLQESCAPSLFLQGVHWTRDCASSTVNLTLWYEAEYYPYWLLTTPKLCVRYSVIREAHTKLVSSSDVTDYSVVGHRNLIHQVTLCHIPQYHNLDPQFTSSSNIGQIIIVCPATGHFMFSNDNKHLFF